MDQPSPASKKFNHRLIILIIVLAAVIAALTALLLLWPRPVKDQGNTRPNEDLSVSAQALPEALQPAEESGIDNSDILASASETSPAEATTADQTQPVKHLTLMIRNHTSTVDPADIKITLDGRVIVDENFKYGSTIKLGEGTEVPAPGLDWKQLPLKLAMGQHQITAESTKGEATFATDFTTTDKDWWASLEYVDGQKFDWQLSELPIIPL